MEQLRNRRQALGVMAAASLASLSTQAWAQASGWKPTERVSYILGVSPGGSVDIYARGVQEALTQMNLLNGQNMIIDYKPGNAGGVAMDLIAKAPADGYTLYFFDSGPLTVAPHMGKVPSSYAQTKSDKFHSFFKNRLRLICLTSRFRPDPSY